MKKRNYIAAVLALMLCIAAVAYKPIATACSASKTEKAQADEDKTEPMGPVFSADSAYRYCAIQCGFGPRTMNSEAHRACGDWIVDMFKGLGCTVQVQEADLKGYNGTLLKARNIMASYKPDAGERVLLCAHWDSRPWADNDPDPANWHKPVMAANDGASGVAVMLEVARLLNTQADLELGVDFLCFDAEDWGIPQWSDAADNGNTFALGAQHWAENKPQGYAPRFGILLDMVGGAGSRFYQEGVSREYAPDVVRKVWKAARKAGFGSFFPKSDGAMITDDHVPLNTIANIPTIDIIPFYPDCAQSSFGPTWHTVNDTMDNIDKNTLRAVGQTIIQVLYAEQ